MRNCDNCLRITFHANSCPKEENPRCYETEDQFGHLDVLWPCSVIQEITTHGINEVVKNHHQPWLS